MGSKKNFAKLMKSSLSSSKKRKLDEAEIESADERDVATKDNELKALRDLLAQKDAKIADLQKQLDWAMKTFAQQEKMAEAEARMAENDARMAETAARMAKLSDEVAEIKNAQAQPVSTVITAAPVPRAEFSDLKNRVMSLNRYTEGLNDRVDDLEERLAAYEDTADSKTREVGRLAEKVERLEQCQLDKLLGKTIKDVLEGQSK